MKSWHAALIAASIVVGCTVIAIVIGSAERYHYTAFPVENAMSRTDRYTGNVELYDKQRGWVAAQNR